MPQLEELVTVNEGEGPIVVIGAWEGDDRMNIPSNWTFEKKEIAESFDRHVREQLPWYDLATNAVAHIARHYLPEFGRCYDVGASTGNIGLALESIILERQIEFIPIEKAADMALVYKGPQKGRLIVGDARNVEYEDADCIICFLTLMFLPQADRKDLIHKMRRALKPGGALIIFDKTEAAGGYPGTVLWRLALAGKVAADVPPSEIVAKELSLGGVQRPIADWEIPTDAVSFFQFGEFRGWILEA